MIFLRIVTLSIHLILMNLAAAGPLLAVWLDIRATRRESTELASLGQRIGWLSLAAFALGIFVGLIQGLLIWLEGNTAYFDALSSLWSSKVTYAFWEIGFSILCTGGYLIWWKRSSRKSFWQRGLSRLLPILAATNLLYHFPTLFTILGLIARGEVSVESPVDSSEFRQLLLHGEVIWFTLHFWLASFAVTGIFTGILCLTKLPEDQRESAAGAAFTIALIVTLLQIPVGFVLTTTLNSTQQSRLMGGDIWCTALFMISLGLGLWLMQLLAGLAFFQRSRVNAHLASAALTGTIVLMTATMLLSRGS